MRSGILFRSHRSARLDRIQGINVDRPVFARLFGTAKLEVSVAGQSGNVDLSYLGSALADGLRADLLRLASGARAEKGAGVPAVGARMARRSARAEGESAASFAARAGGLGNRRVDEFLAPELDPTLAPPESVVRLPLPRVIASTLLGGSMLWFDRARCSDRGRRGHRRALGAVHVRARRDRPRELPLDAHHEVAAVLDRGHARRRPDRVGPALDVEPDHPSGSCARHRGLAVAPLAAVRLVDDPGQRRRPVGGRRGRAAQRTLVLPVGTADDVARVIGLLAPDDVDEIAPVIEAGLTGAATTPASPPRRAEPPGSVPRSWRRIGRDRRRRRAAPSRLAAAQPT